MNSALKIENIMPEASPEADICLIAEGCYPYVQGGVSSWIHNLINSQKQHSFHVVEIIPEDMVGSKRNYEFPENVTGVTTIPIRWYSDKKIGRAKYFDYKKLKKYINLLCLGKASLRDFAGLIRLFTISRPPSFHELLDAKEIWSELLAIYQENMPESSFLDYFWSMRALLGGLYSVLLEPLPRAKIYHATCTGYAGLLAARAKITTGNRVILTEHGIYTNERRIEIASADWLAAYSASASFTIDRLRRELKDLWMDAFANYSSLCYQSCDKVITLYKENQQMQLEDGAREETMQIIRNGVDVGRFQKTYEHQTNCSVAFIGRVVPIKDVKSYISVVKELHQLLPELKAYIIGPFDEDRKYFNQCLELVRYLALEDVVEFTGQVKLEDYFPLIDVVVLTSISEAQPLVVLEAGAAGIPVVSTQVGACTEIIMGAANESPNLGAGGYITPPSDKNAMVKVIHRLLKDEKKRKEYGSNLHERIKKYYSKEQQDSAYREIYREMLAWQA